MRSRWEPTPALAAAGAAGLVALAAMALPLWLLSTPAAVQAEAGVHGGHSLPVAGGAPVTPPAGAGVSELQERIARAAPGDTVVVPPGRYQGPLVVDRPLRLVGQGRPEIDGGDQGTVLYITAPGVEVRGFRIRGSGRSLDREDAGVMVSAPGAVVVDNELEDVLFGVVVKNAPGTEVRGNRIRGKPLPLAQVGDGIRIWYSHGATVAGNAVVHAREVLVESSRDVSVRGNRVEGCLQGLHLMRTENTAVEGNTLAGNSVGAYAMYVTGLSFRNNVVTANRGPSGYGLGIEEGEGQVVEGNWIVGNRVGLYVDNSPVRPDRPNRIAGNVVAGNDVGALLTPVTAGNRFTANDWVENLEQVGLAGGGTLGENEWAAGGLGNYWSDYAGYDAGGDGLGDYPYRSQRLFEALMDQWPVLRWFRASPAAVALDVAARAFPAVAPEPKFVDPQPRMAPVQAALPGGGLFPGRRRELLVVGLLMLAGGGGICALGGLHRRDPGLAGDKGVWPVQGA